MKATIWHNPRCTKSREALAILQATPGIELEVIEYLKTPPTRETLKRLFAEAHITIRQGMRWTENASKGLDDAGDEALLNAIARSPILIERPIVETEKGVRICRPSDRVREIL